MTRIKQIYTDLKIFIIKKRIQINECVFAIAVCLLPKHYYFKLAERYSLFIRAMFSKEIPLGHSTSQATHFRVSLTKPYFTFLLQGP